MIKRLRKSVISLGIVLSLLMQMNIPVLATGGNGGETLLYFVDAGDQNLNTLPDGEGYGLYNSVTDRVFGRDAVSGKRWGVYDPEDPTGEKYAASEPGYTGALGVRTLHTWASEGTVDDASKESSFRYGRDQNEQGVKELYVDYKFELEPGKTYDVEVGVKNPWNNCSPVNVYANRNGDAEGTLLGEGVVISSWGGTKTVIGEATADENGFLSLNVRKFDEVSGKTVALSWIKIYTDEEPEGSEFGKTTKEIDLAFDDNLADGSGKDIEVKCFAKGNTEKTPTYAENGISGKAMTFDGSTYLDMGTSTALQPANLTTSFWIRATTNLNNGTEHILVWNKPSGAWDQDGWYLSCLNATVPLRLSVGASSESLTEFSVYADRASFFPVGEWVHIAVTYNSTTGAARFYRNGILLESTPSASQSKIKASASVHKYIGFNSPGYNGGYATMFMDEFRIYSEDASEADVKAIYRKLAAEILDENESVIFAKEALNPFRKLNPNEIVSNIELPTTGAYGTTISWASNNSAIAADGTVTRAINQDTTVTLTATVKKGTEQEEKTFTVTVKGEELILDDEESVAYDLANISFPSEQIKEDLTLTTAGTCGSNISWTSNKEEVISNNGKVTRPEAGQENATVTLTASASKNAASGTKEFTFTVLAKTGHKNEYTAYRNDQFELDEVKVLDDYYKGAQDSDIAFLKKFDNNRLVAGFRENAGLDKKGAIRYNGWENSRLAGHSVGHYLTAAAQAIQVTGDAELEAKLEAIVHELKLCQDQSGNYGGSKEGFLFGATIDNTSNVEQQFDIIQGDASGSTWVPWYNMHKVVQGFVDVYKFTGNEEALDVANKLGTWVYNRASEWSTSKQNRVLGTEYGGMNDCLYELYKITHDTRHRDAAEKFDEVNLYNTILAEGQTNTLNGRHANTTIPKFLGALNGYVALKEVENIEKTEYLTNAEKFFDMAVSRHGYITGGMSVMEHFRADNKQDELRTQTNCESCCAHNMLKMAKELFKITGKKKYADYYEGTLRNSIMASVNEEGGFSYFMPMATGYYKIFGTTNPATNQYWCCTGSGMENYTKLGDSIYFKTSDSLYVNQYLSSEVVWAEKNLKLTQNADVTSREDAEFTVALQNGSSVSAKLNLRIPDWVVGNTSVKINGTETTDYTVSGEYIVLDRTWADGDKVTFHYPMEVVAYGLPDNDTVYGFKYGPTVLAAKLGTSRYGSTVGAGVNLTAPAYKVVGPAEAYQEIPYGSAVRQVLGTETLTIQGNTTTRAFINNINNNLVKTAGKAEFTLSGTDAETTFGGEGLTFIPFNQLNNERYGIYWYFESEEDNSEESILAAKLEGRFAESIIDSIQPGYSQYENDDIHQMDESNSISETAIAGIGSTRRAAAGGYFMYNMRVDKAATNYLVCQFAAEDVGKTIKITVGNQVIATYTVEAYDGEEAMYQKYFEIPSDVISAAEELTVSGTTYDVIKVKFESGTSGEESARIVNGLFTSRAYSNVVSLEVQPGTGRVKESNGVYTVRIPLETDRELITFTLNTKSDLLYIDNELVNDAKGQLFVVEEGTSSYSLKVYAEDHETYEEYTLKIIRDDGLDAGEEIIVNGDINGNTNNWVSHGGAALSMGWSTNHSAPNSLKIEGPLGTGAKQDITGKVKAGETYEINAFVLYNQGTGHNTNPPANAAFNVSILFGEGETKQVMLSTQATRAQWGEFYGDYKIPEDADTSKVSILFESPGITGTNDLTIFFVDDISMKMLPSDDMTTYTVTLDPMGGNVLPTSIEAEDGKEIGTLPTPVQDGYQFKGWYTDETGGQEVTGTTKVTQNMTIYAQWEKEDDGVDEEALKQAVKEAQEAAEEALGAAREAKDDADRAKDLADAAALAASDAADEAEKAQDAADAAKAEAENAQKAAEEAAAEAEKAKGNKELAETAQKKAEDAQKAAEEAQAATEAAQEEADAAKAVAETAKNEAVTAKEAAETAKTAAEGAQQMAETAQAAAEAAAEAAGEDAEQVREALADAQEAAREARADAQTAAQAKTDAQAAKTAAETAKAAAETARTGAEAAKAEAVAAKEAAELAKTAAETSRVAAEAAQAAAEAAQAAAEAAKAEAEAAKAEAMRMKEEAAKIAEDARLAADAAKAAADAVKARAEALEAELAKAKAEAEAAKAEAEAMKKAAQKDADALALAGRKVKINSAKNSKSKKIAVKWKKDAKAAGYQIQHSLKAAFTGKKVTKNTTKTSYTISALKKSRKYFVRVRAYTSNSKGKKVYGQWSKAKTVVIRK